MAAIPAAEPFQVLRVVQEDPRVSIRRAVSARDGRSVLLKVQRSSDSGAGERLRRELEVGGSLDPAVALRPLEMSTFHGSPALVLEDFGGVPLRQLMGAPMEVGLALRIAARLASCLESVHRKGLVHRNIQPENVYFDVRTGEVKITGFGIATTTGGRAASENESSDRTLSYQAPEQSGRLDRPLDQRADLYSLGVVLVEMLTGARPGADHDAYEWAQHHLTDTMRRSGEPRSCAVSGILSKLLQVLPERRYQTAAELHDDLARSLGVPLSSPIHDGALPVSSLVAATADAGQAAEWMKLLELTQALSNETSRRKLLSALTRLLTERAAARRAVFLSVSGTRWGVECAAGPAGDIPASVVDQVIRTRERVLLDDATSSGCHSIDPYVATKRPKSIACLPIVRHAALLGIVYLENDLVPAAFGKDRMALIELLTAQAGIALENAKLHAEQLREIAERQQAEATLRAILDNMVDAVLVCDRAGQLTFTNPAALRLFGLEDLSGEKTMPVETFRQRLRPMHPDGALFDLDELPLLRALAGEVLSPVDMTVRHPVTGRAIHLRVSAAPLQDQRGALAGAVSLAVNVTEAIELDRLKEQFIRIVAHELKTPIAIVKGYADLLRQLEKPPGTQRRLFDALIRGTDRIDRLVTDLLLLWQVQTRRLALAPESSVDLVELVELVVGRFERETARQVEVVSSPVTVTADRQLIERVLVGLVDNALRYSPGGGDVQIRVGMKGGRASVDIEDHGIGIPKDKQADLFEPFFRAHTDTPYDSGGLGLGLYVAKAIAMLHGGNIVAESKEGEGSTFHFTLPAQVEETVRAV